MVAYYSRLYPHELCLERNDLGYFNASLRYSKEGKDSQHQALYFFTQGIRGMIGPFFGAWLLMLCDMNRRVATIYLRLAVALYTAGSIVLLTRIRPNAKTLAKQVS